ncbi:MAG: hypothetical protein ACC662_12325 [Planctomycetota bacterium]
MDTPEAQQASFARRGFLDGFVDARERRGLDLLTALARAAIRELLADCWPGEDLLPRNEARLTEGLHAAEAD